MQKPREHQKHHPITRKFCGRLFPIASVASRMKSGILAPKYRGEALDRAKRLEPIIREMQNEGYSMRRMATELTKRKVKTPRGGDWHPQTVKMVIQRLAA